MKDGHTLPMINAKSYGEQDEARGVRVNIAKLMYADKSVWVDMHHYKPKDPGKEQGKVQCGLQPWRIPDKEERGKYLQYVPGVPGVPANISPGGVRGVLKAYFLAAEFVESVSASRRC